jgi:hypothetical protein
MSAIGEHHKALAHNLIATLGPARALYIASQYRWYGVAEEIARVSKG